MSVNPVNPLPGSVFIVGMPNQAQGLGTTIREDLYRLDLTGEQKAEIEPLFVKVEELLAQNGEPLELAKAYNEIGLKLRNDYRLYHSAYNYYQKALKIFNTEHMENNEEVSDSNFGAGFCLYRIGEDWYQHDKSGKDPYVKFEESIDFFQKSLDIRLPILGENHRKITNCFYYLGWALLRMAQLEFSRNKEGSELHKLAAEKAHTALNYGSKILEIYKESYEKNPQDVVDAYRLLEFSSKSIWVEGKHYEKSPKEAKQYLNNMTKYKNLADSIEEAIKWKKKLPQLPVEKTTENASDEKCIIS